MDSPKILVIDGDPKNLQILRESLEAAKFRVITSGNGEEGWKLVQSEQPNIIVSEVDTPGFDGFQLLDKLQKDPVYAAIPLVFLTNRRNLEDRIKSLQTGVKDYMIKPLHVKEVIARLHMILRRMERVTSEEAETSRKIVGRLEEKNVEQLLENYGIEKRTGVLSLYDRFERNGEIYFRGGAVVNARLGNFRAEKAVYQMLPWDYGHYIMTFKDIRVKDEITVSNLGLLLQGFKQVQEREVILEQLPAINSVLVKTPLFKQILERKPVAPDANKFVSLFDGKRTIEQILATSALDDVKTLKRMVRLYEQGFVVKINGRPESGQKTIEPVAKMPLSTQVKPRPIAQEEPPPKAVDWEEELATPAPMEPVLPPTEPPNINTVEKGFDYSESSLRTPQDDSDQVQPPQNRTGDVHAAPPVTNGEMFANSNSISAATPLQSTARGVSGVYDSLFNGKYHSPGHFVIISSDQVNRQRFVSTMTNGRFTTKKIGPVETTMDIGQITTPEKRRLEIIALSTEQRYFQMLEPISDSLVGCVVLIKGENPANLKYTGYLINSLKKKIQAPYVVALVRADGERKIPLDFVRYSLQMDDNEQLIEIDVTDPDSLAHLIGQLQSPSYRNVETEPLQNKVQSTN